MSVFHLPFWRGYAPDLRDSIFAEAYLPKQVATLCEAAGRSKALLGQYEFIALFVISSVAWPESG